MRSITVWWLPLVCWAVLNSSPAASFASAGKQQEEPARVQARETAEAGAVAYQAGDYVGAEEKFSRAFELWRAPSLAFWSARTREKLGKWLEADARYREAELASIELGDEAVQRSAQADAKRARADLLARIPRVSIQIEGVQPATVVVRADGRVLQNADLTKPIALNPGDHVIVAQHGHEQRVTQLDLSPSETRSLVLRFSPDRAPAFDEARHDVAAWRTAGWVSAGVGAASLVASGVTALWALDKRDELETFCPEDSCSPDAPPSVHQDVDTYDTLRTVSTVTWITGAVALAGGALVLLTVGESSAESAELGVAVGPGSLQLGGHF